MHVSDKAWMSLHWKCVMSQIVQKLYSIKTNNCSYIDVTDDVWLNRWNDKCEWLSMNVSASTICNESNHTKIAFNWKPPDFYYLSVTDNVRLNRLNNKQKWFSMKASA